MARGAGLVGLVEELRAAGGDVAVPDLAAALAVDAREVRRLVTEGVRVGFVVAWLEARDLAPRARSRRRVVRRVVLVARIAPGVVVGAFGVPSLRAEG